MGLDNGIYVKSNKRKVTRDMLPAGLIYPFDSDFYDEVEILYWRKNWGLRDDVLDAFGWSGMSDEQYKFEIDTPEQVMTFIEIIAKWLDEERWDDDARSIWTYKEIRPVLIQNIINLSIIYTFMFGNPDIYLIFYDSY